MKRLALISFCISLLASTTFADWTAPKWVQLPDVTTTGLDVRANSNVVLADDFQCTEKGPITDIHLWGSWLHDEPPQGEGGAGNVTFTLSIHADVPQGAPGGGNYSMPGATLWQQTFSPGQFAVRQYISGIAEGWYDPSTGEYQPSNPPQGGPPADTICWQYNFLIDPREAFQQQGTPQIPKVYWLDVQAIVPQGENALFGWKTSMQHWNDDAVWGTGVEPDVGGWQALKYPTGHPWENKSIDMAFVITPEPATILLLGIGGVAAFIRKGKARNHSNYKEQSVWPPS